jgi:hypothetical protein
MARIESRFVLEVFKSKLRECRKHTFLSSPFSEAQGTIDRQYS